MNDRQPLHLFDAYGVEIEYMIVDAESLAVLPIADKVLFEVAGRFESEVERGEISWSNELVLHVIELKTNGPAPSLAPLPRAFQQHVNQVNNLLAPWGARLMPTSMHPWMVPPEETRLWPHEYRTIYETYDRIFNCRRHGWANLQAVHLNLPFDGDEEFRRLHAAIRLVLPLLPAIAASSPVIERRRSGLLDTRLDVYRDNASAFPSIAGQIIPEPVFSRDAYYHTILQPMCDDIRPLDPDGTLQHEFLNSRGAIARFDRGTIEIRLLDVQECPAADLAICGIVGEVIRALADERWESTSEQQRVATEPLKDVLLDTIRHGEASVIEGPDYLRHFGVPANRISARDVWHHLCETLPPCPDDGLSRQKALDTILRHGPLGRRILACLDEEPSHASLQQVYAELCDCLAEGRLFRGC